MVSALHHGYPSVPTARRIFRARHILGSPVQLYLYSTSVLWHGPPPGIAARRPRLVTGCPLACAAMYVTQHPSSRATRSRQHKFKVWDVIGTSGPLEASDLADCCPTAAQFRSYGYRPYDNPRIREQTCTRNPRCCSAWRISRSWSPTCHLPALRTTR
ncbi:hypothetical protein OH76DRAFT_1050518 [Lentinus brumalis]|uniref:Uncharacterized protein n=1 Tax=Lentinus brumalis TaxID=2498619 RepID=A0A371CWH3_9APHY|nr:hypothetical protein OH76DRAFT_1050518 [Polyporus brumalis]